MTGSVCPWKWIRYSCAATEPALPPGPVLVATSGPHTLRFQDRQSFALHPLGFDPIRDWRLHFRFESTDPDCLVTDMSDFECRAEQGGTVHTERGVAEFWEPGVWELQLPYESVPGNARDLDVDLSIFRVHLWKTWEREGLMDASLDEMEALWQEAKASER